MGRTYTLGREFEIRIRSPIDDRWVFWGYVKEAELDFETHVVDITTRKDLRIRKFDKAGVDITLRIHFFFTDTDMAGAAALRNLFARGGEEGAILELKVNTPERNNLFTLGRWICTSLHYTQPVDGCVEVTGTFKPTKVFH